MHVSAPVGLKLLTQHCQSAAAGSLFPACSVRSARVTCRSCLTLQTGMSGQAKQGRPRDITPPPSLLDSPSREAQRPRRDSNPAGGPMFPLDWEGTQEGQAGSSAQCWYQRAHRALQQRLSQPLQLWEEYTHVRALDHAILAEHGCEVAESSKAEGRNRYCDVLPFDSNRVILQQQQVPYINASTITYSHPSLPQPCSYIATQGPLPRTAADFWSMVLELQVPVVLMLTNCTEAGMVKCSQYFPDQLHAVSKAGSLEVQVQQQEPFSEDCALRKLQLICSKTGATHNVYHYQYHAWPDHGTPKSSSSIRALCRTLDAVRAPGHPVVVHCSAGIGRTGTLCAIDILMQRLDAWASCNSGSGPEQREVEDTLDVAGLVHQLRQQRMGMVQTPEQYVFVYKALLDDLASRIQQGDPQQQEG